MSTHPCGLRVETSLEVTLELYDNEAAWSSRLEGCVRRVGFDDVFTTGAEPTAIEADRYAELGLILTAPSQGGQYVHPDFGLPQDFIAVSQPNVFAPGPKNVGSDRGGYRTTATFEVESVIGSVAGFGAYFLDTDYPELKVSGFTAYDGRRRPLGPFAEVSGASASRLFLGVVAVLRGTPVAAIHRVELETGDGWVGAAELNEVVALDDVLFGIPAIP